MPFNNEIYYISTPFHFLVKYLNDVLREEANPDTHKFSFKFASMNRLLGYSDAVAREAPRIVITYIKTQPPQALITPVNERSNHYV